MTRAAGMPELRLRKDEDRRLRAGHLWVFSNEVDTRATPLSGFEPGGEALVVDHRGAPLGSACVSPHSLICARIHARGARLLDEDLLRGRLKGALALRERLFGEPFYRLAFGEGDLLPGLVVDRFGSHLTVQIATAAMERRREILSRILRELVRPSSILWDGRAPARALEGLGSESVEEGDVPEELEVRENGCVFSAPCRTGQKTGWFYDQRDNRARLASLAGGADVLDAFCYAGGFGVAAARGGAKSLTFVDSSAQALSHAERNMARNAPGVPFRTERGDAFEVLRRFLDEGRRFDIVCLDPPAFIKRRKDRQEGLAAYRRLNALGLSLVREGGILATSSCSQALEAQELRACVAVAAARRGVLPRLLFAGTQGPDHPVHCSMPETAYLKCLFAEAASSAGGSPLPDEPDARTTEGGGAPAEDA